MCGRPPASRHEREGARRYRTNKGQYGRADGFALVAGADDGIWPAVGVDGAAETEARTGSNGGADQCMPAAMASAALCGNFANGQAIEGAVPGGGMERKRVLADGLEVALKRAPIRQSDFDLLTGRELLEVFLVGIVSCW